MAPVLRSRRKLRKFLKKTLLKNVIRVLIEIISITSHVVFDIFIPFRNKIVLLIIKYVSAFEKITCFTKVRKKGTTNKADFAKFRPRIHKLAFVLLKGVHIGQV